ncbi:MAG: hypothetical protein LLG01_07310 [Planctomycetaceae bacterium]|nr:hypothetical protein [Planctomycetaceae bacterium]
MAERYEQYLHAKPVWGWVLAISLTLGVVTWCMIFHMFMPDVPRVWDFGAVPDVPAQSVYSSSRPSDEQNRHAPRQIEMLPGAHDIADKGAPP